MHKSVFTSFPLTILGEFSFPSVLTWNYCSAAALLFLVCAVATESWCCAHRAMGWWDVSSVLPLQCWELPKIPVPPHCESFLPWLPPPPPCYFHSSLLNLAAAIFTEDRGAVLGVNKLLQVATVLQGWFYSFSVYYSAKVFSKQFNKQNSGIVTCGETCPSSFSGINAPKTPRWHLCSGSVFKLT